MKTALIAALAAMTLASPVSAEWKYKSTDEYKSWLNKINELCKQQVNPLDNKEAFGIAWKRRRAAPRHQNRT